jgi:RNA polymerase sigma-70 factor, ECF subfamily
MSSSSRADETAWIEAARRQDEQAFARLVEVYQGPVFNLCYRMLGSVEGAEDAAQEVFLRAYRKLPTFDPERKFVNWILSIGSHYCIDQLRRLRLPTTYLEDMLPGWQPVSQEPGPESSLAQKESQASVQDLLGNLPPLDRAAIVMRYWHEMGYEEIARALHISASAAKSRLHRARRALAAAMPVPRSVGQPGEMLDGTSAV